GGRRRRRLRRPRRAVQRRRHRRLQALRGAHRGGLEPHFRRERDRHVPHSARGAAASPRQPGRLRGERRLDLVAARHRVRLAVCGVEGGGAELHALAGAGVRHAQPALQLRVPRRREDAARAALPPSRRLRGAPDRLPGAAEVRALRRPHRHRTHHRVPRLRRGAHDQRRRAHRRRRDPGMILEVLARQVVTRGAHPFLRHEGRDVSYAEFDRLSNRAAHGLRALGVERGDRVTLAVGNSVDYVVTAFAVLKAGGVLNPVNPALGEAELRYILGHAGPRLVVTDAASDERMRGLGVPTAQAPELSAARPETAPAGRAPAVALGRDDASTLLYTSGTTGAPKGVLFTHGRSGTSGPHFIEALGLRPDDVLLAVTPLFHGNAWGAVVTSLHAGATVAFPVAFHASAFWPLAHETGATVVFTLGTVLAMLLTREPSPLERTSRLRLILGLGSAPIRARVRERFGVED